MNIEPIPSAGRLDRLARVGLLLVGLLWVYTLVTDFLSPFQFSGFNATPKIAGLAWLWLGVTLGAGAVVWRFPAVVEAVERRLARFPLWGLLVAALALRIGWVLGSAGWSRRRTSPTMSRSRGTCWTGSTC